MKNQVFRFALVTLLAIASIVCVSTAQAGNITTITPVGVTSSTSGTDTFDVGRLIDDSGLTGPPFDATATHGGADPSQSWVSDDVGGFGSDYFATGPVPELIFDLGGTFLLDDAIIWNYGATNSGNVAKDITISFSTTGVGGTFGGDVNVSLSLVPDAGVIPADLFTFAPVSANAVRFTITDNFFGEQDPNEAPGTPVGGGDRIGLSEVKFGTAVPEPSSMILLGMGLVGLACRRSRRHPA